MSKLVEHSQAADRPKIALDPNNVQATYLARACGTARFATHWALAEWGRQYAARNLDPVLPAPSELALRRQLNAARREQFSWMLEVTKCAPAAGHQAVGRGVHELACRLCPVTQSSDAKASTTTSAFQTTSLSSMAHVCAFLV